MMYQPTDQEVQREIEKILRQQLKRQALPSSLMSRLGKIIPPYEHSDQRNDDHDKRTEQTKPGRGA